MTDVTPKFRRRKTDRPGEIVAAALEVFAEKGFATARLDDIAARAGVSKGALYLYFETKEDLFLAVARTAIAPNLGAVVAAAGAFEGAFADLARMILPRAASVIGQGRVPAVVRMVIGESRAFPQLARIWHDDVVAPVIGALSGVIARAQARGEVGPGDPRFFAFSLMAPVLMGALFQEVFAEAGAEPIALPALAAQHAETALSGLLTHGG
jgi:AcrR family transcriptional regulator